MFHLIKIIGQCVFPVVKVTFVSPDDLPGFFVIRLQ
jgi:hypothetical protein